LKDSKQNDEHSRQLVKSKLAKQKLREHSLQLAKSKLAKQKLREQEAFSKVVLENTLDAFVAINTKGKITRWNNQAEKNIWLV